MAIPLPINDDRRWIELVEEQRLRIPQIAPTWTDHNHHDPGITLLELVAWQVEQSIFQSDQIPTSSLVRFAELAGESTGSVFPARVVLSASSVDGVARTLPARTVVSATGPTGRSVQYRLDDELVAGANRLVAVQSFDGLRYLDRSTALLGGSPIEAFGPDPAAGDGPSEQDPALLFGFAPEPAGPVTMWLWPASGHDQAEIEAIVAEELAWAERCRPFSPPLSCDPDGPSFTDGDRPEPLPTQPAHPSESPGAAGVWEMYGPSGWVEVEGVEDRTRLLTVSGPVNLPLPTGAPPPAVLGAVMQPLVWFRLRLAVGRPAVAPTVAASAVQVATATQLEPVVTEIDVPETTDIDPASVPVPGTVTNLSLRFDGTARVIDLAAGIDPSAPEVEVIAYLAPTAEHSGTLTTTLAVHGRGNRLPGQAIELDDRGQKVSRLGVWTIDADGVARRWTVQPGHEGSEMADRHLVAEPDPPLVRCGDGNRGRVFDRDETIVSNHQRTEGLAGMIEAGAAWSIGGANDGLNRSLGIDPITIDSHISVANAAPSWGAADPELPLVALARSADRLWAHERLNRFEPGLTSLDDLPRSEVLRTTAPERAVTGLDYERLALDVPGAEVLRARAWPDFDPDSPCGRSPGTVALVVVPGLPIGRPEPTGGLLRHVERFLDRRRLAGTRLLVVGPRYRPVSVTATVATTVDGDPAIVKVQVDAALEALLDPLTGGATGTGWPFGRDVHQAEVLQTIDGVPGVDHVVGLELAVGDDEQTCGSICIGQAELPVSGSHTIVVEEQ